MRTLEIATVGDRPRELVATLRKIPFTKLVLLHEPRHADAAERVADVANTLMADVECVIMDDVSLPRVLDAVTGICARGFTDFDEIFVNASSGDPPLCCSVVLAALANGVKAINVHDEELLEFPSSSVPFWRFVTGPKLQVLAALMREGGRFPSLTDLAREAGLDTSVLNYHLRDAVHQQGLADTGLVRLSRSGSTVAVEITSWGVLALVRMRAEAQRRRGGAAIDVADPDDHARTLTELPIDVWVGTDARRARGGPGGVADADG